MDDKTATQLRTLIKDALENHFHNQAIFFATKLVSLSKSKYIMLFNPHGLGPLL